MQLADSRRLTGPSVLLERPGAIVEVALDPPEVEPVITAWEERLGELLAGLGWGEARIAVRRTRGGAALAFSAPIDALYTATELNEAALAAAAAHVRGEPPEPAATQLERLRELADGERDPRLRALLAHAERSGLRAFFDDEFATVGSGAGSRTWARGEVPNPEDVAWEELFDVPVALVTGTNGKSTTVRMTAAIARAAGRTVGTCTTDGVMVGDEAVAQGDYSGPEGARCVLRDRRTEIAVLETARGGLLRRGLAVTRAEVAAVLNVQADHLGESLVDTVEDLARVKLLVERATPQGPLVLGADDPLLRAQRGLPPIVWFGLEPDREVVRRALEEGGVAFVLDEGHLVRRTAASAHPLLAAADVPATLGGAARHNVANSLAAAAIADGLGHDPETISLGLSAFGADPMDNPGRANLFEVGGALALVDFAHNPAGLRALLETARRLPARRMLVVLGQAGDRPDAAIDELARTAWDTRPDRILIKEMPRYLRGRAPGEVPGRIEDALRAAGAPAGRIGRCPSEQAAVREALAWARPGDVLVLPVHEAREEVAALLRAARGRGAEPGEFFR